MKQQGYGRRWCCLKQHVDIFMKTKSEKFGRNDPCPCGSGLKYKKCCIGRRDVSVASIKRTYEKQHKIRFKSDADIAGIRRAGDLVIKTLDLVAPHIVPGVETDEINRLVHDFTIENGAKPAPLGYRGYPKSVCVSVNEVICHGIPGAWRLNDGDIVNIDVTSILDGYYADASKTFFVGTPGPDAQKIVHVARESLRIGMAAVKPGNTVGHIGAAIQKYAEGEGCSVVREFVGHGLGFEFHEPPQIPHYGKKGEGVTLLPGMVFTIEPMINLGGKDLKILEDNWTAITVDGSLSAQFEQSLLVTEDGFESLTPYEL
jgi:methionyl aminopeptidase